MIGGLTHRSQVVRRAVGVTLVAGLACALTACGSADGASATSLTPVSMTVTPTIIVPTGVKPQTTAQLSGSNGMPPTEAVSVEVSSPATSLVSGSGSADEPSKSMPDPTPISTVQVTLNDSVEGTEAADRSAIEAQWLSFWEVGLTITDRPEAEWDRLVSAVSIDPIRAAVLDSASQRLSSGKKNYGQIKHRIFWQFPVGGSDEATIGDCQDHSGAGTEDALGNRSAPGGSSVNMRGVLVRTADGVWRVREYTEFPNIPCPQS